MPTQSVGVKISPDILSFPVEEGVLARANLQVKNVKNKVCAFKVKTTKPKLYVVRPNQGLLLPGEQLEVAIVLNEKDKKSFLQSAQASGKSGGALPPCTDKFLVQTVALSNEDGDRLARLEGKDRQEALASLWPSFRSSDMENNKLAVEHKYSDGSTAPAAHKRGLSGRVSGPNIQHLSPSTGGSLSEAENLQKKYNELLQFSVDLCEQRDQLKTALENSKIDLNKERGARKAIEASAGDLRTGKPMPSIVRTKTKQQRKGFPSVFIILIGFVSFLLGRKYGHYSRVQVQNEEQPFQTKQQEVPEPPFQSAFEQISQSSSTPAPKQEISDSKMSQENDPPVQPVLKEEIVEKEIHSSDMSDVHSDL
mmetsp:Transcript_24772/g.32363  ORF Transcript_24772/g.32363 Transcript_24772/m.32363 type:complete len:366 (+) Transcript_24772:84-1181(+)